MNPVDEAQAIIDRISLLEVPKLGMTLTENLDGYPQVTLKCGYSEATITCRTSTIARRTFNYTFGPYDATPRFSNTFERDIAIRKILERLCGDSAVFAYADHEGVDFSVGRFGIGHCYKSENAWDEPTCIYDFAKRVYYGPGSVAAFYEDAIYRMATITTEGKMGVAWTNVQLPLVDVRMIAVQELGD